MAPPPPVVTNLPTPSQLDPTHLPIQSTPTPASISSKGMGVGIAVCTTILLMSIIVLWLLEVLPVRRKCTQQQKMDDLEGSAQSNPTESTVVRHSRVLVKVANTQACVHAPSKPLNLSAQDAVRAGSRLLQIFGLSVRSDSSALQRPSSSALTVPTCNSVGPAGNVTPEASGESRKPRITEKNDEITSPVNGKDSKAERVRDRDTTSLVTLETMKFGREDGNSQG
ncbi:hypothetical protein M407DRAFT_25494 [Tulasnella calospora MUT 4182]|uniref:Uncharacterized protein n=1 Tax=Tulasnella calospora MUT 4182 TaxID=1051891 RepID=A0A0C3KUI7_9AGAM|nr:hypothetical protein M407DRAFT_25494 [Tulasnella calospora MUT 4182]